MGDSAGLVVALESGLAAGVTVSVFCSHAARSAAPAKMHISFFIGCGLRRQYSCYWLIEASNLFGLIKKGLNRLQRRFELHPVGIRHRLAGQSPFAGIDPADESRLFPAGFIQAEIRQQLNVTIGHIR